MDIATLFKMLTWDALNTPLGLGLWLAVIMFLFIKPALDMFLAWLWRRKNEGEPPADWKARGIVVNLTTFILSLLFAFWRERPVWTWDALGPVVFLAVLGVAVATVAYEMVKNVLTAADIDISRFNIFS